MNGELKISGCPFCGDTSHQLVEHIEGTILHPSYRVRCDWCGVIGPSTDQGNHIELWNTRHSSTPAPGALPELAEAAGRACDFSWDCHVIPLVVAEKASRAYAEQCRAGVWLPIESAPKNGSTILVCSLDLRDPETAWWDDGWVYNWHEYDGYSRLNNVTHWMPLPAPPALQSAFADDEGVKNER